MSGESYEVRLKYFNPSTNYWEHKTIVMTGYKTKNEHTRAGKDAAKELGVDGYLNSEVIRVTYI